MQRFLFLLFSASLFLACEKDIPKLVISGQVKNPAGTDISFRMSDSTYKIMLDSTGAFTLNIAFDSSEYVTFIHGAERSSLYLMPNSDLKLELDAEMFDESLSLTGNQAEPSQFLLSKFLLEESFPDFRARRSSDAPMELIALLDSMSDAKIKLLSELKIKLPETFYNEQIESIKYERIYNNSGLVSFYQYNAPDSMPQDLAFYAYQQEIDFNREDLLTTPYYKRVLESEISRPFTADLDWNNTDDRVAYFTGLAEAAQTKISNEKVLASIIKSHIDLYKSYIEISVVEELLGNFEHLYGAEELAATKEVLAQIKALSPGAQVPDFNFETLEGENFQLSSLKGKLVYIDLWATWCGPCIAEQPSMEILVEKFQNSPVAFLAVSIDNTKEPWIKMVNDRKLAGTHVYAENNWQSDIMRHFVVEGIPKYILLDEEGKIIIQDAPRPSGNIAELIESELGKMGV
ncbi:MAG: TlpA family protein disulfide reductase [Cyclobacteriaceae bacterium]